VEFHPVERDSLVQKIVAQILQLISDGTLCPGDRLPSERELIKKLGVGRSTVREALRSLAMMNLVDARPGQGSFVKDFGVSAVIQPELFSTLMERSLTVDLLEMRKLIEPAGAELAANRASEEELSSLQQTLDECRVVYSVGGSTADLSARLHLQIARCTHNGVLVMFMESILGLLTDRGTTLEHIAHFTEWEMDSHQHIIDALVSRDTHQARRIMSRHLEESTRRLLDAQESNQKEA